MNIGSLYKVKKWHWLLFPSKEITAVGHTAHTIVSDQDLLTHNAEWYSKEYNCNVTWFEQGTFIVFLEKDGLFKKVLTSDGKIGWTWFDEDYNDCFEEVKSE